MNWQQEQQAFWDLITQPRDLRDSEELIDSLMAPHRELSAVAALAIYNNAYHQRLIQISAELYPVLHHTLGQDVYTRLWLEYIAQHPPRPGPMGLLGENLLAFTRAHSEFGRLPALLDIIALESLLIELFDKADEMSYTLGMLQQLPSAAWPTARWRAKQDWALLYSRFDLEKYWADMQQHRAQPDAVPGETSFAADVLQAGEACLLVRRQGHRMQFQRINPPMALFLEGIQAGKQFALLCEDLDELLTRDQPAGSEPDVAAISLQLLLKAIELELLAAQSDSIAQ